MPFAKKRPPVVAYASPGPRVKFTCGELSGVLGLIVATSNSSLLPESTCQRGISASAAGVAFTCAGERGVSVQTTSAPIAASVRDCSENLFDEQRIGFSRLRCQDVAYLCVAE